jgi:hypothetical protein
MDDASVASIWKLDLEIHPRIENCSREAWLLAAAWVANLILCDVTKMALLNHFPTPRHLALIAAHILDGPRPHGRGTLYRAAKFAAQPSPASLKARVLSPSGVERFFRIASIGMASISSPPL